jgi:hypothetical protein
MGIKDLAITQCFPLKTGRLAQRNQASSPVVGGAFCAFTYGLWEKKARNPSFEIFIENLQHDEFRNHYSCEIFYAL